MNGYRFRRVVVRCFSRRTKLISTRVDLNVDALLPPSMSSFDSDDYDSVPLPDISEIDFSGYDRPPPPPSQAPPNPRHQEPNPPAPPPLPLAPLAPALADDDDSQYWTDLPIRVDEDGNYFTSTDAADKEGGKEELWVEEGKGRGMEVDEDRGGGGESSKMGAMRERSERGLAASQSELPAELGDEKEGDIRARVLEEAIRLKQVSQELDSSSFPSRPLVHSRLFSFP